jgi:methylated-DNA-[protein]-cysteine S-methyltransferase
MDTMSNTNGSDPAGGVPDPVDDALRAARGNAAPASVAGSLAELAAHQGLLDVAYTQVDSPLGPLLAASTPRGLVRLAYVDNDLDAVLDGLARRVSPRVLEAPARLDEVRRELEQYFAGRRRRFELAVDWALVSGFSRRVLEATAGIAYGEVASYRDVASRAGSPRATRAAGNALGANPMPIVVPCHRVLRTGGGIGGYTGGLERKRYLLGVEGVEAERLSRT